MKSNDDHRSDPRLAYPLAQMKSRFKLSAPDVPGVELETIDRRHLDLLRTLKNAHRRRFFFQDEISEAAQQQWYDGYCERPDDWMLIVRGRQIDTGCIGYRLRDDAFDLYNVLRDERGPTHVRTMSAGLDILCSYLSAVSTAPIRGRVLADNPVVRWSKGRGFAAVATGTQDHLSYVVLEFDRRRARHRVDVTCL